VGPLSAPLRARMLVSHVKSAPTLRGLWQDGSIPPRCMHAPAAPHSNGDGMVMVKGLGHVACLYGIVNTDPIRWAMGKRKLHIKFCISEFATSPVPPPPRARAPSRRRVQEAGGETGAVRRGGGEGGKGGGKGGGEGGGEGSTGGEAGSSGKGGTDEEEARQVQARAAAQPLQGLRRQRRLRARAAAQRVQGVRRQQHLRARAAALPVQGLQRHRRP